MMYDPDDAYDRDDPKHPGWRDRIIDHADIDPDFD